MLLTVGDEVDQSMILELKTFSRSLARRSGLGPGLHSIRSLWHRSDYEDKFADLLLTSIRSDDFVWDVGANEGFYTTKIARIANGVAAFEPIRENFEKLKQKELQNVECHQLALGSASANLTMSVAGCTSSIVPTSNPDSRFETVTVSRGDDLHTRRRPTIVKIDVEGYEPEVISGLQATLAEVRAVFIEMHFAILDKRGMRQAPASIVRNLKQLGFAKIKWPDASHVAAFRTAK